MIKIICVGKIKENFYKEAIKEYQKRLTKYTKLEIIEVEDEPIAEKAKKIEGTKIQSKIKKQGASVPCKRGKRLKNAFYICSSHCASPK